MKRLLYLITGLDYAGAENQVIQLCRGFRNKGYTVQLVSMLKPAAYLDELAELDVEVKTLNMDKGVPDPRKIFLLKRMIQAFKPDIVHSHMVHANLIARITRLFVKMPLLICTAHNINEGGKLREFMYRITDPLCDLTTNVSQEAVNRYIAIKAAPKHKIILMPNGINLTKFSSNDSDYAEIREELEYADEFIWLAVGRFVPEKDYLNMVTAFSEIRMEFGSCKLLIAGAGPERAAVESLCQQLQISEHVRFLGIRTDIPKLMNAADAYLMSSKWEGLPMVLLEAAASELPIVATDVGGNKEVVIDQLNGYLTAAADTNNLISNMRKLMLRSVPERKSMGEKGRAHVIKHYDIDAIINGWSKIYEKTGN